MKSSTVGLLNKAVKPCLGSQVMVMEESRSFIRPPENTTVLCPRAKFQQLRSLWDSVCLSTSTPPMFTHTSREIVVGSEKCVAISCLAAQREEEAITQTRSLQRDFKDCVLPAFCNFMGVGSPSFTWNFVSLHVAPLGSSPAPQQNPYSKKTSEKPVMSFNVPLTRSSGDSEYLVSPPVKLPVRLVFLLLNLVCLSAAEGTMVFAQTCQILVRNLSLIGKRMSYMQLYKPKSSLFQKCHWSY